MKLIPWIFIIYAFSLTSCATGLVATHNEPPFICFKKKCREMAKIDAKNRGNKQNYQKSRLLTSRKKRKQNHKHDGKKVKKHTAPSF